MLIKYTNGNKINKSDLYIMYYTASWCSKCKQIKPIIEELSNEFTIIEVDVDLNKELVKEKGIMSIPTIQIYKNNQLKDELIGFKNIDEIRALIING